MASDVDWIHWLQNKVVRPTLVEGRESLDAWRRQRPTKADKVKNFENWALVELVKRLSAEGAREIRTNGTIRKRSYDTRPKLKGRKAQAGSISPDIAVDLGGIDDGLVVNIEMKTQFAKQDYLDDVRLVHHHNLNEANVLYRSCFLWIGVGLPDEDEDFGKAAHKVADRVGREAGVDVEAVFVEPWLAYLLTTTV